MIKEIKKIEEVVSRKKYCDDCDKEIPRGLACSVARCEYCKKDLCENCIGFEESTWGDYRVVYCNKCWGIGEKYRPTIETLNEQIEELYKEWRDLCKKS